MRYLLHNFNYRQYISLFMMFAFFPGLIIENPFEHNESWNSSSMGEISQTSYQTNINPEFSGCGGQSLPVQNSDYEQRVVELVNIERSTRGMPPLKRSPNLDDAARYHAADMGQDNYFDHDSYDRIGGNLTRVCYWYSRVAGYYPSWSYLGENIAAGSSTPEQTVALWMGSEGHSANILSTSFWEIGVGYYQGSGLYFRYWAQDFGKRIGQYPLVINNESSQTDNREVELYIYGSWTDLRLRNDLDAWSNWQPFQNQVSWQLPPTNGIHTVYVELRKNGSSIISSDTINLEISQPPVLGNLPEQITFTYDIQNDRLLPPSIEVTPLNVGNNDVIAWQISTSDTWFDITPESGITPGSFTITPTDFLKGANTTYSGAVILSTSNPPGVLESPNQIPIILLIQDTPLWYSYIPLLINYP